MKPILISCEFIFHNGYIKFKQVEQDYWQFEACDIIDRSLAKGVAYFNINKSNAALLLADLLNGKTDFPKHWIKIITLPINK